MAGSLLSGTTGGILGRMAGRLFRSRSRGRTFRLCLGIGGRTISSSAFSDSPRLGNRAFSRRNVRGDARGRSGRSRARPLDTTHQAAQGRLCRGSARLLRWQDPTQAAAQRLDLAVQEIVDHPLDVPDTLLEGARFLFQFVLAGLRTRDHQLNRVGSLGPELVYVRDLDRTSVGELLVHLLAPDCVLRIQGRSLAAQLLFLDAEANRKLGLLLGPPAIERFLELVTGPAKLADLLKKTETVGLQATHVRVGILLDITANVGRAPFT
ncbi:MAG: hypothetical protein EB020_06990, partial [Proteobacteria bacterium]|nr:hypothetical protein [Pseudomonadota bacterium]